MCYFYKPSTNCILFTAVPSIPNLICKLYVSYGNYPRNVLEVSKTLYLPSIIKVILLCAIHTNKIRNTVVLLLVPKFQAWSVSYVHLTLKRFRKF